MYYGNSFNCGRIRTGRAVLVAISIPIFNVQLEKSREAVDAANIRAAYAEVMTAALSEDSNNYTKEVDLKQKDAKWNTTVDWPKDLTGANSNVVVGGHATITYTPAGAGSTGGSVSVTYAEGAAK
jgi:type II secretory pathway pseudopilin PulG